MGNIVIVDRKEVFDALANAAVIERRWGSAQIIGDVTEVRVFQDGHMGFLTTPNPDIVSEGEGYSPLLVQYRRPPMNCVSCGEPLHRYHSRQEPDLCPRCLNKLEDNGHSEEEISTIVEGLYALKGNLRQKKDASL